MPSVRKIFWPTNSTLYCSCMELRGTPKCKRVSYKNMPDGVIIEDGGQEEVSIIVNKQIKKTVMGS